MAIAPNLPKKHANTPLSLAFGAPRGVWVTVVNARRVLLGVAIGLLVLLAALAVIRVGDLAAQEATVAADATVGASPERRRLVEARLVRGQQATFEVCAGDGFRDPRWVDGGAFRVVFVAEEVTANRVELSPATLADVRRGETIGCLAIGTADAIQEAGAYAVDLDWSPSSPSGPDIQLVARILSRPHLDGRDRGLLGVVLFASFLIVFALALLGRGEGPGDLDGSGARSWRDTTLRLGAALGLVIVAFFATGLLPPGAAFGLIGGLILALTESAAAIGLAPRARPTTTGSFLALGMPRSLWGMPGWAVFFPLAVLVGVLLVRVAFASSRLVPSTGVSPVQTILASPSGRMSFLALAVIAPVAEEIFFRGFVYGLLARWSRVAAFLAAWLLFTLAHAQQDFHQWGALVAILITGLALTTLRAVSGSTAVSAVGHLSYNGLLALLTVGAP